jgi:hypothetical protein
MTEKTEPTALTPRFADALVYAERIHAGQSRKGTKIPYISHPLAVASIALEHGANEDEAIAALLHDAIEDSPDPLLVKKDIRRRFGPRVAAIVEGCSDSESLPKPPWRERKERYLTHLREAPSYIRLVSAADKLHNAQAILADYRDVGEALWKRFTGKKEGTLWYYRTLADLFLEAGPQRLAEKITRVVSEIERLSTSDSLPGRDVRVLQKRVIASLAERFVCLTGTDLNDKRQVSRAREAVVPTVSDDALERSIADVRRGSGGEILEKFYAGRKAEGCFAPYYGHFQVYVPPKLRTP